MVNKPSQVFRIAIMAMFVPFALFSTSFEKTATLAFTSNFFSQMTPVETDSGTFGGSAKIVRAVRELRQTSDRFVLFDTGNHFAGNAYNRWHGVPEVELANLTRYDAMLLGAEELAMGEDRLDNWAHRAAFPIILSNLDVPPQSKTGRHVIPYRIIERSGVKVGVFGMIKPETAMRSVPFRAVEVGVELLETARQMVDFLRGRTDVIVMLSQLDIDDNIRIAEEICEIDIIVSGEWRNYQSEPMIIESTEGCRTIIGCALGRGFQLGVLNIKLTAEGKLIGFEWKPVSIDERIPPDQTAYDIVSAIEDSLATSNKFRIDIALDARDAILAGGESNAGNLLCEALLAEFAGASLALVPAGSFFGDVILPEGEISENDIIGLLPYDERAAVLSTDGATLVRIIEKSVSQLGKERGGFFQIAGGEVSIDTDKAEIHIEIAGKDIDPNSLYILVTTDFVAGGGYGYTELETIPFERGDLLHEILIKNFVNGQKVPSWDNRIKILP